MHHRPLIHLAITTVAALTLTGSLIAETSTGAAQKHKQKPTRDNHEIWLLDQSNTYDSNQDGTLDSGGTLYIYQGDDFTRRKREPRPEVIDLGGAIAESIKAATGSAPVRPHYISFNRAQTHAIITFVATGHLIVVRAADRKVVYSVDVGVQAHAANPSPPLPNSPGETDDHGFILVANQNGKLVQRIDANYTTDTFALDNTATLDLANGFTPSGAPRQSPDLRPDNAAVITYPRQSDGSLAFVTLRGGGAFVINPRTTPISIVAEYSKSLIEPAGLIAIQATPWEDDFYFNSGGGGASELGHQGVLYKLPWTAFSPEPASPQVDSPTPKVVFDFGGIGNPLPNPNLRATTDSHGIQFTRNGRYLWTVDRAANRFIVVDPVTDLIASEIDLVSRWSNDPTPDLVRFSPDGKLAYASLRGPVPLTGNNPTVNNAKGSTPGLGVFEVFGGGSRGRVRQVIRTSNVNSAGVETSDPHGIQVRVYPSPLP